MDDRALVEGCVARDEDCLAALVKEHLRMVFSVAYGFTHDPAESEDLCLDVFEKVLRNIGSFRGESSLRTWIYAIAAAHCTDHRRKQHPSVPIDDGVARDCGRPNGRSPEDLLIETERTAAIHGAVSALPMKARSVIVLNVFENMSTKEVALALGIPEGTVYSRLNKARALLRRKLARFM